jgi:uncharacterized protein
MIFKLLSILLVGFLVYIVFFKKNRENKIDKNGKNDEVDTMLECPTCNVLSSKDDAILSNGKYFCSKECLK